ncbi:MAG: ubiquinone/menaquinone biosynthesis methyltransferase [Chloroflexi bacterium]|nr:ubiquinone/menaquinone biosynthesis methyltransferase [Chloroflexota bacterium]
MSDVKDQSLDQPYAQGKEAYVRAMFARIAACYDLMNTLITFGYDQRWRRLAVQMAAIPKGGTVIDVGTGSGELSLDLARHSPAGRIVAVDFCADILERAQRKAIVSGSQHKIVFQIGDALNLPFSADAFDAAISGFVVRNLTDIAQGFREMRRVIRPGGRVVCLELTRPKAGIFAFLFGLYLHRLVPILGQLVAGDGSAYTYLPRSIITFPLAEELADIMRAVGLKEVSYRLLAGGAIAIHVGIK